MNKFLTISEIVNDIVNTETVLNKEQKEFMPELTLEDIQKLRPKISKKVGNMYLLWNTKNPLCFDKNEKMLIHPSDLSQIITIMVWEKLQSVK